jgi:hypothetical protein
MKCPRCSTENNESNTYCHACGLAIDAKVAALEASVVSRLDERMNVAIATKFKDAKLLEVEVAEGVAKRLIEWAKALGVFIAIPVAILALVLAFFGIKSYTEFTAKIDETKKSAGEAVEKQLAEFKAASKKEFDTSTEDFKQHLKEAADKELAAIHARGQELVQTINNQVEKSPEIQQIKRDVKDLKTKFTFHTDRSVPDTLKSKLDTALQQFQAYLRNVGFRADENLEVSVGNAADQGMISYYNPAGKNGKDKIFIEAHHANEPDPMFLEYGRHVLLSERPPNLSVAVDVPASSELNWDYYAINSGVARYYACSFQDQPIFWRNAPADVRSSDLRTVGEVINAAPDWAWANISGAELWSALCWDLREALSQERADKLLREAWFLLNEKDPSNLEPGKFRDHLVNSAQKIENGKFVSEIKEILKRRGL